jgi:iron complex outermembrane receptor protein
MPIIGANVIVPETTVGTITDFDGKFTFQLSSLSQQVRFSYIGYKPRTLSAKEVKAHPIIVLQENTKMLDAVVVIGYGSVKKSDATGAVLSVKPDALNKGSQVSAQDALVGKVAGVNIVPSSGAPGSGATIRVRMGSSLSASNDPLIVIDGVPVDNNGINGSSNVIGSINPNDIASFTVLKDASSTAIYGSRASNGVIIITTKKGGDKTGKPKFNYNNTFTLSQVGNTIDVLNATEYRSVFNQQAGAPQDFSLGNASTDWQKEIFRTSFGQEHNFSMTGKTKISPYRLSLGYTQQAGIIKTNDYSRMSIGLGASPEFFNKHLKIDLNVKGSREVNHQVANGVVSSALSFDPTRPIMHDHPNGIGKGYFTWMSGGAPIAIANNNPVAELNLTTDKNVIKRSIGNVALNYKIHGFEAIQLHANLGYDVLESSRDKMVPEKAPSMYIGNQKDGTGLVYTSTQKKRNYLLDLYASYDQDLNETHHLNAMLGYGWQHFWNRFSDQTKDPKGKELISPYETESENFLLSYYGRINYSIAQKYLFTFTLRADASSRFKKGNQWGYFPSAAFAWRLFEEDFLKENEVLSNLKLRLSYGMTGQQDIFSDYPYMATYTGSYNEARYRFGDTWYTTYRPNGYDPNIKWETTSTYNVGLDWGILNNRISGTVDYYQRYTKDLLNNIYVPAGSNFTNMINTNIGSMKNQGLEIAINAVPIQKKNWEWKVSANFTWNASEITKLNTIDTDDNYVKTGNAGGTGKYLQIHKVGETPYTYFLLRQAYDKAGKPKNGVYLDAEGNETTSESDANKYVTRKSPQAPYFFGFSTHLRYKNWDMGINAHGSIGNYVFNYTAAKSSFDDLYSSQGTSSNILRSSLASGFTQQRLYSDYFLENASFMRLDNITLGYTFKSLWKGIRSLRLSAAVQNVFTISGYSGLNPEIYSGIDKTIYPKPRVFMMSLNLNF